LRACPALLGHHGVPHAGHHGNHGSGVRYFRRANEIRNVFAIENHVQLPVARHEIDSRSPRQCREMRRYIERHAVAQRLPCDGAVHRSAIQMNVAQQSATRRATVLFPEPAGPSIAMISFTH